MHKLIGATLFMLTLNANAVEPFSAKCTEETSHSYDLQFGFDSKTIVTDKWSIEKNKPRSISFSFAGDKHLLLEDSQLEKPEKIPVATQTESILMAVRIAVGTGGSKITTYAINLAIPEIVGTTVKSALLMNTIPSISTTASKL